MRRFSSRSMRRIPRQGFEWTRVLGLGMVALAVLLVTDADYPVPRPGSPESSAAEAPRLAPRPLAPIGDCARASLEFTWDWQGADIVCELVVLDQDLEPIWVSAPTAAHRVPAEPSLRALLHEDAPYYWLVRAADAGDATRRSATLFRPRG